MKTLPKQISIFTEDESTSSAVGFRANHTAKQVSDLEKKMTVTSGRKCLEQFGRFNHHGLWAKTFGALLIGMEGWYSMRCNLTWKLKGTRSNRFYFQLVGSTLHTKEIESGLLPTPTANPGNRTLDSEGKSVDKNGNRYGVTLAQLAKSQLLPTPRAAAARGNCSNDRGKGNLEDSIAKQLPTTGKTSRLNTRFVLEMMGFPPDWTELPFLNGETNQ